MYDLSDHVEPVTGLHLEPFPERVSTSQAAYYVLATTPKRWLTPVCVCVLTFALTCRIYEFVGVVQRGDSPQFPAMFDYYRSGKG